MIATSHVLIGGAIGVLTKDPTAALAAGIVSHLVADCFPHLDAPFRIQTINGEFDRPVWTRKLIAFAFADSVFAFLLTLFIWQKYFSFELLSPFAWGALGGYLPDFIDNTPLWSKQIRELPGFKQFHKIHVATHSLWRFQFPMPNHWFLGTVTQIVAITPCLYYILSS
jgi:hypothetical protein